VLFQRLEGRYKDQDAKEIKEGNVRIEGKSIVVVPCLETEPRPSMQPQQG